MPTFIYSPGVRVYIATERFSWVVIGLAAVQVNFWVNTLLASHLPTGSLAALNYAWLLMLLPQGIVAQGVATAAFPTFATLRSQGRLIELRQTVTATLRGVLFLAIPAAVGLLVWRTPLVRLLLERGEFTAESTALTTAALAFYSFGLIGHSAVEILARAFYALTNSTPFDDVRYLTRDDMARFVTLN